ncbi:MAG: O-antigen ligase family protein [Ardenticatenaceae bacterium]|nr:O-antigen ligase family protein [Anaerolineales bacterium]MCB8921767.1 O-antigen ligase family protein [Ardenticatenaceae bacterium]MCB8990714.1 O-antigen ligase family protein [Ardenticatenaceae bacterium]
MRQENKHRFSLWLGVGIGGTAVLAGLVLAYGGPLAAAALLLAGAAAVIVLRDIEIGFWGVIAVVCLLPFATLPIDIGITPTFLDVAIGAVVGIWLLRIVTGQQRTIVTGPVTLPLIIFILTAVFSFIFGLANGPLTPTLLRKFAELLLSLGFVIVIVDYCRNWERLERLVKVIVMAGAAASLIAIVFWLLPEDTANTLLNMLQRLGYPGGWVIRYIEENPELSERAIGTSVDPNVLGGLLLMIGALAGPQVVAKRPFFPRWLAVGLFGIILLALILTFSRGAMVGLVAGLGFVALVRYRRLIPYMAVGGLLLLLLPIAQEYIARFVEGIQGADLATQMRFGEYKDALTLIARYPVFGVGFAGTPDIDLYLGVANVYFTIAQLMGLVGLGIFLAVMGTVFGYAFLHRQQFKQLPQMDPVWLGLHGALMGGLVAGIFDHYLFNLEFHHAVTAFWLLVGLAVAATRLGVEESKQSGVVA